MFGDGVGPGDGVQGREPVVGAFLEFVEYEGNGVLAHLDDALVCGVGYYSGQVSAARAFLQPLFSEAVEEFLSGFSDGFLLGYQFLCLFLDSPTALRGE